MADDGEGPLKLETVAEEVIKLRREVTDLKAECARCRFYRPIGFTDEACEVKGGSLVSESTHKTDRPADEFGDDPETDRGIGRPS